MCAVCGAHRYRRLAAACDSELATGSTLAGRVRLALYAAVHSSGLANTRAGGKAKGGGDQSGGYDVDIFRDRFSHPPHLEPLPEGESNDAPIKAAAVGLERGAAAVRAAKEAEMATAAELAKARGDKLKDVRDIYEGSSLLPASPLPPFDEKRMRRTIGSYVLIPASAYPDEAKGKGHLGWAAQITGVFAGGAKVKLKVLNDTNIISLPVSGDAKSLMNFTRLT